MKLLTPETLRPGLIIQSRSSGRFGRLIRWCLTRWIRREKGKAAPEVWGSHTALVIEVNRKLFIGDAVSPFATATPIETWNRDILAGRQQVRVLEVIGATQEQELKSVEWWIRNVLNKPYDWGAFPRLLFKSLVKSVWSKAAGWEWAWYCSEGVAKAWAAATDLAIGPLGKVQATPLTVEKRAGWYGDRPTLREITDQVLVEPPADEYPLGVC